jgi:hypothetical protein
MKTIWNIVSFLAIAHLVAIAVVVGWLWQSQRLDRDRVERVRTILALSIPAEQAAQAEDAKKQAEEQAKADETARMQNPPVTSSAQIASMSEIERFTAQSLRRMAEEKRQLSASLEAREQALKDEIAKFEADREAYEQSIKDQRQAQTDEQFRKAVKLIESLPPKQGKDKLTSLVSQGQMDQAVAYLNAMSNRAAGKILKEFKSAEESKLATDLLERLRKLGRVVQPDASTDDADPPLDNSDPSAGATPDAAAPS